MEGIYVIYEMVEAHLYKTITKQVISKKLQALK